MNGIRGWHLLFFYSDYKTALTIGDVAKALAALAATKLALQNMGYPDDVVHRWGRQAQKAVDNLAKAAVVCKLTSNVGAIAAALNEQEERIRKAIHRIKKNLKVSGAKSNPDVLVDTDSGEVYPKKEDGTPGDPIGNIHDELEEMEN